jgi:dTMP kinase
MGKIIVIEGTDYSGKETQSKLLKSYLEQNGIKVATFSYPQYNTPTGKIIGGPLLGKPSICPSWFNNYVEVDSKVASLYFAADRRASLPVLKELINNNEIVIIDRYIYSNMGHQGSKIEDKEERLKMYKFLETLEFDLLELPRPDLVIFLYLPYSYGEELKKNRVETLDEAEKSQTHQIKSERTYLELTELYGFKKIDCFTNNIVKTREEINKEVISHVKKLTLK